MIKNLNESRIRACARGQTKKLCSLIDNASGAIKMGSSMLGSFGRFSSSSIKVAKVDPDSEIVNFVFPGLQMTLLHFACYIGQDNIVTALLDRSADTTIIDEVR